MRETDLRVRHLTDDEIVDRVFPSTESAPVPLHLAACAECQARVARLREAWLLDRGAVEGRVEAVPAESWEAQSAAVMARVRGEAARPARGVFPFRLRWSEHLVRRPALAVSSVAAALALVTGLTLLRPRAEGPGGTASGTVGTADTARPVAVVATVSVGSTAPATSAASGADAGSESSQANGYAPAMSPADASDDQLLRDVERLVAGEGPLHELLPQEGV